MSVIYKNVLEYYNFLFFELNDSRTRDIWPSVGSLLTMLVAYLYIVKKIGPEWMKDKKPYELKNAILVYNIFQIIASGYLFYESIFLWIKEYSWMCEPVDYSENPLIKKIHKLCWMYLILKFVDLLDTVFFVLRKKNRQISTLHLYHHFMMPICIWIGFKYYPNGHGVLLGIINCFVHTIMYTYYLIAGLGPQYQKYLWWKKHLTTLQLVQFAIIFFHNLIPLLNGCNYPKWINIALCLCSLHFVYMFGNFYYVNYIKNNNDNKKHKKQK